jgi:hypothetical protein
LCTDLRIGPSPPQINANLTGIAPGGILIHSPPRLRIRGSSELGARQRPRDPMQQDADLPPAQIAALKKQLEAINARLLSLERERQQLKNAIASVRASLKRIAAPAAGGRGRPLPLTRPRQPYLTR